MTFVLAPGRIIHMVPVGSTDCHPAVLLFAHDPMHADLRDLVDDDRRFYVSYSDSQQNVPSYETRWHTAETCASTWPALPDGNLTRSR